MKQGIESVLEFLEGSEMPTKKTTEDAPAVKKRGHYEKVECPYCHKMVGNLKNHVNLAHPGQAPDPPPPVELTKEELLGQAIPRSDDQAVLTEKEAALENAKTAYYCMTCVHDFAKPARIRKGEAACWRCGAQLNWEGIE